MVMGSLINNSPMASQQHWRFQSLALGCVPFLAKKKNRRNTAAFCSLWPWNIAKLVEKLSMIWLVSLPRIFWGFPRILLSFCISPIIHRIKKDQIERSFCWGIRDCTVPKIRWNDAKETGKIGTGLTCGSNSSAPVWQDECHLWVQSWRSPKNQLQPKNETV